MNESALQSIVIFSGGLDSSVCLASEIASFSSTGVLALSFDYGQRHRCELNYAKSQVEQYQCQHIEVPIDLRAWSGTQSSLMSLEPLPSFSESRDQIPSTYVPARNLIFLSVAASIAESKGAQRVVIGVNAVDYSGYPDCRPEFLRSFQDCLDRGTKRGVEGSSVQLLAPLAGMSKREIVETGHGLSVPFDLTWSCYLGEDEPCRKCDSCLLRAKGFNESGVDDPLLAVKRIG